LKIGLCIVIYWGGSLTVGSGNLQFRYLQNSEDLRKHYTIEDREHCAKHSSVSISG